VPKILSIKPTSAESGQEVVVNVSYYYAGPAPRSAYCRFGSVFVRAEMVTEAQIQCRAPVRSAQVVNFAISLDSGSWSAEDIRFVYKQSWRKGMIVNIASYVLAALLLITFISCVFCRKRGRGGRGTREEGAPFLPGKGSKGIPFARRKRAKVDLAE
jgi:hypothetical protein